MRRSTVPFPRGAPGRLALWLVLALSLSTSGAQATPPRSAASAGPVGSSFNLDSATRERSPGPSECRGSRLCGGLVYGAILGDRQRMIQVALVFMGIAILILVRGNRF